ncbi:hypothetical protein WG66_009049, partial [Moniliophthora roreri]
MPFFRKKDSFDLPIQPPPNPTHSSHSGRQATPRQTLPWDWRNSNICSRKECLYLNRPQCASGTFTCIRCHKGEYTVTPEMAERVDEDARTHYRFRAWSKRQLQEREEAERVKGHGDVQRYRAEDERHAALVHEIVLIDIPATQEKMQRRRAAKKEARSQERRREDNKRRQRAPEIQHAFHEPVNTNAGHGVNQISPNLSGAETRLSLSDYPIILPCHQSPKSSSLRQCIFGNRVKTQANAAPLAQSGQRAPEIQHAFHEPVNTHAGHGVDKVSPNLSGAADRRFSRSDFPMVPYHQSSESSSSRECVSGDRLKTQASAGPPSFGSTTRFVGPPSRQIPPECRPVRLK